MKDFVSKAAFGFVMAQLFPGALATFAIAFMYFSVEECRPEGLLPTANYVLQVWNDASLGRQLFLLGLCVGVGMFIHGLHWASLGHLEQRFKSVFKSYWHDKALVSQALLGPVKLVRESWDLFFRTPDIQHASIEENAAKIHKDYIPHLEVIHEFYLYPAQFLCHTAYALIVILSAVACYMVAYGPSIGRVSFLFLAYATAGIFFVLGRVQLRNLFGAELDLVDRSGRAQGAPGT